MGVDCTSDDLINRWGSRNIQTWSDLSGADAIDTTRVSLACQYGNAERDQHLRGGPYTMPIQVIDAGTELLVRGWAEVFAVHWLYFSRGLLDKDEQGGKLDQLKKDAVSELHAVRSGARRLNARRRFSPSPTGPVAI